MKNQFKTAAQFYKKVCETVYLFKGIWKQHSIALIQSPLDSDKTSLVTEILESVAVDDRKVVYVDTDNRAETFVEQFVENPNLIVFTPSYDDPDAPEDYADLVFNGIEEAVAEAGVRTFVIDSISRIAARSFGKNASPSYLMKRLVDLQARHNLSLLVIAHSSTKAGDRALKLLADCQLSHPEEKAEKAPIKESAPAESIAEASHPQNTSDANQSQPIPSKVDGGNVVSQSNSEPRRQQKPMIANPFHHDSAFWHRPDPFEIR